MGNLCTTKTVTGTLANIVEVVQKENIQNPSMIVVGEVVTLREKIHWLENIISEPLLEGISV